MGGREGGREGGTISPDGVREGGGEEDVKKTCEKTIVQRCQT